MVNEIELYLLTALFFGAFSAVLWELHDLSVSKMILMLFSVDIAITIEAALYSNVILIALLHVITVPSFFALIYADLIKEHNAEFRCFLCGGELQVGEEVVALKRGIRGRRWNASVHKNCIDSEGRERKAISGNKFRRGIPS